MLTVGRPLSTYSAAYPSSTAAAQTNTAQNTSAQTARTSAERTAGSLEESERTADKTSPTIATTAAELIPGQQVSPDSGVEAAGESADSATEPNTSSQTTQRLDEVELALIKDLASRDREVRIHEQAHAAIGGAYAGSPSYSFTRGPDGKQYATGGEVQIDISAIEGDPEATIEKMRQVARAALSPAEPSAADRAAASAATQAIAQAQAELSAISDDESAPNERSSASPESDEIEVAPQGQQNFVSRAGIEAYRSIFAAA